MFIRVQVFADAAHINAMFKEIAAGTVEQHEKWGFTMVFKASDKLNLTVDDLVIVPVWRSQTHKLEYHLATVTEVLPAKITADDFNFTVNTISAKLSFDGDIAEKITTHRAVQAKEALKARMVERAQELAEQEKYRKLAEQDDEMKKLYQEMYGEN